MIGLNELQHRVSRLDNPYQFVELCAALVLATAAKNSVALSGFSWNLNISEPDGGVDQRFIGADKVVPRIIPGKTVVYQCKAGDGAGSANDIALNDVINKSNVKRRLEDGDHFVYFAGRKRHAEFERDITEKLKENGFPVPEERIHYLGPEYLAGLLRNYPGLLARYLNLHHECLPLDKWSERASMSNPFVSGESPEIQSRLTSLSNHLMSGTGFTEIYGAAGNGKSRMVLEALKTCGQEQEIEKHVLYTHDFKVAEKLISRIRDFPEAEALLVADDLEPSEIRLLKDLYPTCPRGFGIVAIGLDTSKRDSGGVFSIPSVSAETLNLILQKALPGLPGESRKRLAELCSGSPKLAVLLAEKIDADPSILQRSLLTNQEARDTVAELLSTDWSPEQLKALSAVALFSRLGWHDEYEKESEIIF